MSTEFLFLLLCEWLAKSFVILLIAAVVVRVWHSATASQKYLIWFAALAAVLLLPATRAFAPRWTIFLGHEANFSAPAVGSPAGIAMDTGSATAPVAWVPTRFSGALPDWRLLVLGTWLGGVILLLGARLQGAWRLRHLERRTSSLEDPRITTLLARARHELGLQRNVRLRVSDECRIPLTWGGRHPVILLPAEAATWSDTRLLTAMRHELGHILHRDYSVRWLVSLACAFHWPNPLIWLAARSLRIAQEQAVDDLVLRAGTAPGDYAAQLVEAARIVGTRGLFARHSIAMASPSTLETRVVAILDERRQRNPLNRWVVLAGALAGVLALASAASARLEGPEQKIQELIQEVMLGSAEEMRKAAADVGLDDPAVAKTFSLYFEAMSKKGRLLQMGLAPDAAPIRKLDAQCIQYLENLRHFFAEKSQEMTDGAGATKISADTTDALVTREWKVPLSVMSVPEDAIMRGKEGEPILKGQFLKDWLIARGVAFGEGASALYIMQSSRLIVRNTPAQLDLVDKIFAQATANLPPTKALGGKAAPASPAPQNPLLARAAQIIIPKVEFREVTVREALDYLRKKAIEFDPQKTGINIVCQPDVTTDAKLTMSLSHIPLSEALRYVAGLADLNLVAEPDALVLRATLSGRGNGTPPSPVAHPQ